MIFAELRVDSISFFAPWGSVMNLPKGSFINLTDENDIYGIARQEFFDTYAKCDINGKFISPTEEEIVK